MFDGQGLKDYVGIKSAASYYSGLNAIEKNFTQNGVDEEYEFDGCISLLSRIEKAKNEKGISVSEKKTRQNWYSHLKKYICYKRFLGFKQWMVGQPQKNNPTKVYSQSTINNMANLLKDGLPKLKVYTYNESDCFGILTASNFEKIYKNCYSAATVYDKEQGHSDFRNGLDFYMQFLKSDTNTATNLFETKLSLIVELYKEKIKEIDKEERYKWEAIHTYKNVWNIESENFAPMLKSAFRDSGNLLKSGNYYPYKMACVWAENEPESVRRVFKNLFDESVPFETRYLNFRTDFTKYYEGTGNNHYQDLHAISVYLTFEYPEKYYFYKYSVIKDFIKNTCFVCGNIDAMSDVEKMQLTLELSEKVLSFIKRDEDLLDIHFSRLDDSCFFDENLHILTQDIIYFGSKVLNDNNWWPSLEEYNPNLTKDDWKKYILEVEKPHHPSPMKMLKGMLELGGEASCKQLTAVYGGHPSKYVGCAMNLGRRAKKYFNLPVCMDDEQERYFPIPFLGKAIDDEAGHQYIYKIRSELLEALNELDLSDINPYYEEGETLQTNSIAKNTILYGPPGTGKTYNTACYAVAIVENKDVKEVLEEAQDNYYDVFERYTSYKNDGLIQFVTFHQSYGYEDFIEGIKPVLETEDEEQKDLQYKVADGVFKAFCNTARNPISQNKVDDLGLNKNPTVWKVSLWSTGDNSVRTECMENGHIRIGWDDYGPEITSETDFSEIGGRNVLNSFIYKMQKGDIVLSCYSSTTIDAIGVVTGDYEWSGQYDDLNRVRKVNWLIKGIEEDIVELNDGNVFTLAAVYKTKVSVSDALSIVEKYNAPTQVYENKKQNMVFIIDEINRGNISKIFGELITLIEDSKRLGAAEELKVVLPYSQKPFGVPANVYILGTMNTADRSIAALDTALRRRFSFVEMMPDTDVLENVIVEGVNISEMLTKMNKRIEVLFDREHTIGHAYFINLTNSSSIDELAEIFENKIIPLLQEYFYEDYERIRLVLADNQGDQNAKELQFITCEDVEVSQLFGNVDENVLDDMKTFTINKEALKNPLAYQKIYK